MNTGPVRSTSKLVLVRIVLVGVATLLVAGANALLPSNVAATFADPIAARKIIPFINVFAVFALYRFGAHLAQLPKPSVRAVSVLNYAWAFAAALVAGTVIGLASGGWHPVAFIATIAIGAFTFYRLDLRAAQRAAGRPMADPPRGDSR